MKKQETGNNERASCSCCSPLWTDEVIVICQIEVLQLHPEPGPRSASTPRTTNFRPAAASPPKSDKSTKKPAASAVLSGAFTDSVYSQEKRLFWSLNRPKTEMKSFPYVSPAERTNRREAGGVIYPSVLSSYRRGGRGRGLEEQPISTQHQQSVQRIDFFFFYHLYWFGQWQM